MKIFVKVNVVENQSINKSEEGTIKNILTLIENNLGKTDLEKSTKRWTDFVELKQKVGETAKDFVTRFEQLETALRNSNIKLPQKALAIHLITKSSLSETSKENVLT